MQRLDLQEVAKLGRGSEPAATASQEVKAEEPPSQAAADVPATGKDKDTSAAGNLAA